MVLRFIPPALATLVDEPPAGAGWIHEIKQDGFRCQLLVDGKSIRVITRQGNDWTDRLKPIATAAKNFGRAIVDGELVVQDENGVSDFDAILPAIAREKHRLVYIAFDLMHHDGEDVRLAPLEVRRARLRELVMRADRTVIAFSEAIEGNGPDVFRAAEPLGVEGIVSKRKGSTYRSGNSPAWVKAKYFELGVFDVVGVDAAKGEVPVALLARREPAGLRYAGRAMINLKQKPRDLLWGYVERNVLKSPPAMQGKASGTAVWVKPGLRAKAKFLKGEQTLRHASLTEVELD